jgi:hypothetical protein
MSEALTVLPDFLSREPAPFLPGGRTPLVQRPPVAVDLPALPSVQPGKLWLVEFPLTEPVLSPLEYRALTTANVVIYDRSLEKAVARALPLGSYAEPATPGHAGWERAIRFARDGWSVAKLVDVAASFHLQKISQIDRLTEGLLPPWSPLPLPVFDVRQSRRPAVRKNRNRVRRTRCNPRFPQRRAKSEPHDHLRYG